MLQSEGISLPETYLNQMKSLLSEADFFAYLEEMKKPAWKGLRLNPLKGIRKEDAISMIGTVGEQVPWEEDGYYYEDPLRPGISPLHEAGLYYIQEPSAMSAARLLGARPGERVLDLCAAPGGKSTQIAAMMQGQGVLIANEPNAGRAKILSQNIERMGVANAAVLCEYPTALKGRFEDYFDRILVDAPCSGEGMFRKNPEAAEEWEECSPLRCHLRQLEILDCAAQMLRGGGTMVYSTCTFNHKENEETVDCFLQQHPEFCAEAFCLSGLPEAGQGKLHLYPFQVRGEGHFLCLLKKKENEKKPVTRMKRQHSKAEEMPALPDILPKELPRIRIGERIWSPPQGLERERVQGLHCLRFGLGLALIKGQRAEPDHALAMAMRPGENAVELSFEEMIRYQAGETLQGHSGRGYVLVHYHGLSLGFGKCSDGMIKNHYPKGLRVR